MKQIAYKFNNSFVTFINNDGKVMANATEMAKSFGKTPKDWLRTEQSDTLIHAIASGQKCLVADIVRVVNGGNNPGTWMQEDAMLLFAQWLSPEFYLWCNNHVKELLKHGLTATTDTLENIANNPDLLIEIATNLKKERAENERLLVQTQIDKTAIAELSPKAEYCESVLQANSEHTVTTIASQLNMSAVILNRLLKELKIIRKTGEEYSLTAQFQGHGYAKPHTHTYIKDTNTGETGTKITLRWTEKGRAMIVTTFNEAIKRGVLVERKGRYFIKNNWRQFLQDKKRA